jgi:hypothetical protein
VADPAYRSFDHRHHSYLARGRYVEQLDVFSELLGRDRVLVIDANRFFENPQEQFVRLTDWLGLPSWVPSEVGKLNARPREPMDEAMRRRLTDYYEPYDSALIRYLGEEPSWRS